VDAKTKTKTLVDSLKTLVYEQKLNSQKQKEDEDGFILLAKESIWPKLFGQHFMNIDIDDDGLQLGRQQYDEEEDDMLFYVQQIPGDGGQEVKVFRKHSKNLPGLGDPHVNWEESVYLNLIMHHLEYDITCAVCTRLPNQDLKVLCKKTLNVHASHHMRRMDSKGESSDQSYPNIFFIIDSYDEVFEPLSVEDEEIVCVELTARFKTEGAIPSVIFLGSVKHEALLNVYDAKTTLGTKMVQKMSWMTGNAEHYEYIRMRGPHGKGYAEMRIGQCKSDLVEHNNINKHRSNSAAKSNSNQCSCRNDDNEQIYAPTTTHNDNCVRCGKPTNNKDSSKFWSNTIKWFQQKPNQRAPTLSPHLTYVTLPWSRIMKDVLQVKQKPVFLKEQKR